MSPMERIAEVAEALITAADEDDFAYALAELRDEVAAPATTTGYINELIGGYVA